MRLDFEPELNFEMMELHKLLKVWGSPENLGISIAYPQNKINILGILF
jgi:hypothetical protein